MAPTTTNVCAGCQNPFQKRYEYLACSFCKHKYDLDCANVDTKKFATMDTQQKNKWKCPECCCKQPKTGNSNTPVRASAPVVAATPETGTSDVPSAEKSTRQKKESKPANSSPKALSAEGDSTSEEKLREIIKEELTSTLSSTIKRLVTDQLKNIREELVGFRESMNFFNEQFECIKKTADEQRVIISQLTDENQQLRSSIQDLTTRMNIVETHMRECNIEINGVPENKSENLVTTLIQLSSVIKNPVTNDDIQHVTRVAKLSEENDRPRAIIAKLRTPRLRDAILAAVSKFNKDNAKDKLSSQHLGIGGTRVPVYVAEHLTPAAKKLHAAARKRGKELDYKYVWARYGRIYVRKNDKDQALVIKTVESLDLMN